VENIPQNKPDSRQYGKEFPIIQQLQQGVIAQPV
jgi:hypothetical protein